jgi:glycine/D-amino acid oxidase-like deaminating enzyme
MRVAVLGAGIMGSSLALFLARRGAQVTLIDAAPKPFCAASRWNEGKVHLGYLYAADPSLKTARALLPGGIAFKLLTEELIGLPLDPVTTAEDDIYLVHRDSIIASNVMQRHFDAVSALVREHPGATDYLVDTSESAVRPLSRSELDQLTDTRDVVAGFRVVERSVWTNWVADRYVDALYAESRIELSLSTRVTGVKPATTSVDGQWHVVADPGLAASFDFVVNALWEGRPAIDATVGLRDHPGWSHRYRLALFVQTDRRLTVPSAVLALGPFGDVKNYTGRNFYLSWYPAGLIAEGHSLVPPDLPSLDESAARAITNSVFGELSRLIPSVNEIIAEAQDTVLQGGWVFAGGHGSLRDPFATVHRRYDFGIRRRGSYISVDTGKYSTAAWLAKRLADQILDG